MLKDKLLLTLIVIAFGSIGLIVRNVSFSSVQIAMIRGLFGALFIFIYSVFIKSKYKMIITKQIFFFIGVGGIIGINWVLLFQAYQYLTVSTATIIYYTAPLFLIVLAYFVFKEKLGLLQVGSIVVALVGLFLVVDGYQQEFNQQAFIGIGLSLAAAILYAVVITINKWMSQPDPMLKTGFQLLGAFIVLFPYVMIKDPIYLLNHNFQDWTLMIILGFFHTGIAYTIYFNVVTRLKSHTVGIISYFDPLSAIVFSTIFLNESFGLIQMIGTALILSATLFNDLK